MRVILAIPMAVGALICGLISSGCSQTPGAPSPTAVQPTVADMMDVTTQAANVSAEDLAAHGWDCRPAPIPNRVGCSPPNQPHPAQLPGPPPPADRPATFTLLVFDNGVFIGTDLLIRSDLYHGQPCKSTGGLYRLFPGSATTSACIS